MVPVVTLRNFSTEFCNECQLEFGRIRLDWANLGTRQGRLFIIWFTLGGFQLEHAPSAAKAPAFIPPHFVPRPFAVFVREHHSLFFAGRNAFFVSD